MQKYATLLVQSRDGYDEFKNELKRLEKQVRDSIVEVQKLRNDIAHSKNKLDVMVEVQASAVDLQAIIKALSKLTDNIVTTGLYEYKKKD